ncbi:hypothetical protein [Herbaspirillum huttiense]|uniref:hypothetical protein n=1 Tax=Herbaspirillum huttiense TaxID=863372 RepID=UPI0018E2145B|nr:hypothetical protein [Herbaspirillum huttiense]
MDAEGGENIDLLTGLLGALVVDAKTRKIFRDEFYFFDARALRVFKKIQGISEQARFPGCSLEQAYLIWNQTPREMLQAMLRSFGVAIPDDYVQTDEITFFESQTLRDSNGAAGSVLYMRYIPPTPFKSDSPDFWTEE